MSFFLQVCIVILIITLIINNLRINIDIGGKLRSQRYKYVRHCATDCLIAHVKAGWNIWTYYPMQSVDNHQFRGDQFYKIKNYEWWTTVHRWDWRFTNSFDKENYVFSNMEYTKWRKGRQYEMHNLNHEY